MTREDLLKEADAAFASCIHNPAPLDEYRKAFIAAAVRVAEKYAECETARTRQEVARLRNDVGEQEAEIDRLRDVVTKLGTDGKQACAFGRCEGKEGPFYCEVCYRSVITENAKLRAEVEERTKERDIMKALHDSLAKRHEFACQAFADQRGVDLAERDQLRAEVEELKDFSLARAGLTAQLAEKDREIERLRTTSDGGYNMWVSACSRATTAYTVMREVGGVLWDAVCADTEDELDINRLAQRLLEAAANGNDSNADRNERIAPETLSTNGTDEAKTEPEWTEGACDKCGATTRDGVGAVHRCKSCKPQPQEPKTEPCTNKECVRPELHDGDCRVLQPQEAKTCTCNQNGDCAACCDTPCSECKQAKCRCDFSRCECGYGCPRGAGCRGGNEEPQPQESERCLYCASTDAIDRCSDCPDEPHTPAETAKWIAVRRSDGKILATENTELAARLVAFAGEYPGEVDFILQWAETAKACSSVEKCTQDPPCEWHKPAVVTWVETAKDEPKENETTWNMAIEAALREVDSRPDSASRVRALMRGSPGINPPLLSYDEINSDLRETREAYERVAADFERARREGMQLRKERDAARAEAEKLRTEIAEWKDKWGIADANWARLQEAVLQLPLDVTGERNRHAWQEAAVSSARGFHTGIQPARASEPTTHYTAMKEIERLRAEMDTLSVRLGDANRSVNEQRCELAHLKKFALLRDAFMAVLK